jgi:hypothetical protein
MRLQLCWPGKSGSDHRRRQRGNHQEPRNLFAKMNCDMTFCFYSFIIDDVANVCHTHEDTALILYKIYCLPYCSLFVFFIIDTCLLYLMILSSP